LSPEKVRAEHVTMRVIDVAPNEALLATLTDRLERASAGEEPLTDEEVQRLLDLDPAFAETAKSMLREFIERTDHLRRTKA
jgi:hypothetical protein